MKLTNGQIQAAIHSLNILCNDPNRLPTLAASRAGRALAALRAVYPENVKNRIILDHGQDMEDGRKQLLPGGEGWDEFITLMDEEQEVVIDLIRMVDVEAGWTRSPEGKKEQGLDISPANLAILLELGIVTEGEAEKAAA